MTEIEYEKKRDEYVKDRVALIEHVTRLELRIIKLLQAINDVREVKDCHNCNWCPACGGGTHGIKEIIDTVLDVK